MDIRVFVDPEAFKVAVDVFAKVMAKTPTELSPVHLDFLKTFAKIHESHLSTDTIKDVSPKEVLERLRDSHAQKRLIQLAAIACLLNRPVQKDGLRFLQEVAGALKVKDPVLKVVRAVYKGRKLSARLMSFRRMMRTIVKETYVSEGVLGPLRFFGGVFLRWTVNKNKLWSYKRLGLLPENTLGRQYWKHMTEVGFGFPGEMGGIPDAMAYHDIAHVLSGYDTSPQGEICQGAFQAGCRRKDGFVFLQFVTLQFHQGIKITPVAEPEIDLFVPSKVLWAVHRGAQCTVDLTSQWNYWEVMNKDLSEVRREYQLLPAG